MRVALTALGGVALLCSAHSVSASTYYVSADGSDDAEGTSPSAAWATIARVAAAAETGVFEAGDSVLLRRGDVFYTSQAWNITGIPAYFTLGAYGSTAVDRPLIARNASAWTDGVGSLLGLHGVQSGFTVSGVAFQGGEAGLALSWWPTHPADISNISVTDCAFTQQHGATFDPATADWWAVALSLSRGLTPVDMHAFTISNVTVANNVFWGSDTVYSNGLPGKTWAPANWTRVFVKGVQITGNAIVRCEMNNVFLDDTTDVLVANNTFLRNAPTKLFVAGTTDIIVGTLGPTDRIEANEIRLRGEFVDPTNASVAGPDGCAIDLETNPIGLTIAYNFISSSYGAGLMIFGHTVGPKIVTVAANAFLDCGCAGQAHADHGGIAFMSATNGASGFITDNVLAGSCPDYNVNQPGADANFTFSGNILDGQNGQSVAVMPVPTLQVTNPGSAGGPGGNPAAAGPTVAASVAAAAGNVGVEMHYTLDGSRPTRTSPLWPGGNGGALTLPPRTTALFVKAFPVAPVPGATVTLESPVEGGVFVPGAGQVA